LTVGLLVLGLGLKVGEEDGLIVLGALVGVRVEGVNVDGLLLGAIVAFEGVPVLVVGMEVDLVGSRVDGLFVGAVGLVLGSFVDGETDDFVGRIVDDVGFEVDGTIVLGANDGLAVVGYLVGAILGFFVFGGVLKLVTAGSDLPIALEAFTFTV
jgi:hypothetical protein